MESNMILGYADYHFENTMNITATFYFRKYFDNGKGIAMNLKTDAIKNCITEIIVEKGIFKRVAITHSGPLIDNKNINVYNEYLLCLQDNEYIKEMGNTEHYIGITIFNHNYYNSFGIFKFAQSKDNELFYRFGE
jgi:hypothetical protein